jgi:TRAP-type C4-dicarboxylate transport system permease small subunit
VFARIYKLERSFVAWATALMGVLVFLDVIHRVTTRPRTWTEVFVIGACALVVTFLAVRARRAAGGRAPSSTGAQLGVSAAIVVGAGALLKGFVTVMPNGLVWSQTMGLVLMLWIAVVGASMATHEHRHLSLDLGSKLWPKSVLPKVQAIGNTITALFCFFLAVVSVISLRKHLGDWQDTDGAGGHFAALALPKWIAFAVMPPGFAIMGARFIAQAIESFRGKVEEDDAMHMLGLDQSDGKAS